MTEAELILKALKDEDNHDVRLTHGHKWLYWDAINGEWAVRGKNIHGRYVLLESTAVLQLALDVLLAD